MPRWSPFARCTDESAQRTSRGLGVVVPPPTPATPDQQHISHWRTDDQLATRDASAGDALAHGNAILTCRARDRFQPGLTCRRALGDRSRRGAGACGALTCASISRALA